MKDKLLISLSIICIAGWTFSCDTQKSTNDKSSPISNILIDTIVKDIPRDKKGRPSSYYRNKSDVEGKLGLNTLENGFDSLQVRIWYGYAFKDSSQLVIFKYSNKEWNAELLTLVYHYSEKGDSIQSISKEIVQRDPKSGWQDFSKKIFELQITTLPDNSKINNYPEMADGDNAIIEVSTMKSYRIYSYKEPAVAQNTIAEAKKMEQILELVEDEFNFKRIRKL